MLHYIYICFNKLYSLIFSTILILEVRTSGFAVVNWVTVDTLCLNPLNFPYVQGQVLEKYIDGCPKSYLLQFANTIP